MKRIRGLWPRFVRGLLSLCVLMGICAMLLPLPIASLPQNSPEKDDSEPFPCQNRPCGCRSAEQCWKKCCCFNNVQKVAWARAHNVKVPDFVWTAAKKEQASNSLAISDAKRSAKKSTGFCEHATKRSLTTTNSSCCRKATDSHGGLPDAESAGTFDSSVVSGKTTCKSGSRASKSKWVLAFCAAECQGQGPSAFCFPTSIIAERIALVIQSVAEIETTPVESERLQKTSLRPPLPPPKIV